MRSMQVPTRILFCDGTVVRGFQSARIFGTTSWFRRFHLEITDLLRLASPASILLVSVSVLKTIREKM